MKSGDRITTPDGPATVRGFEESVTLNAGRPIHESWVIVEPDSKPGTRRWYLSAAIIKGGAK